MKLHETNDVEKWDMESSQWVRLFDVFVFALILIGAGVMKDPPKWIRVALVVMAVVSILYNAFFYIKYKNNG